jgi:hypothetical protein
MYAVAPDVTVDNAITASEVRSQPIRYTDIGYITNTKPPTKTANIAARSSHCTHSGDNQSRSEIICGP